MYCSSREHIMSCDHRGGCDKIFVRRREMKIHDDNLLAASCTATGDVMAPDKSAVNTNVWRNCM
jgi:hypothetical protein